MGWLDIKRKARQQVHSTFVLPALFFHAADAAIPCGARLHYKSRVFGDLDREGYAQTIEDIDYVILDSRELIAVEQNDKITFPDIGRAFRLEVKEPTEEQIFVKWQVVEIPFA